MGRDKEFKCIYCGKFIAYDDIPDKVGQDWTPDSEYSYEKVEMWHKSCAVKYDSQSKEVT